MIGECIILGLFGAAFAFVLWLAWEFNKYTWNHWPDNNARLCWRFTVEDGEEIPSLGHTYSFAAPPSVRYAAMQLWCTGVECGLALNLMDTRTLNTTTINLAPLTGGFFLPAIMPSTLAALYIRVCDGSLCALIWYAHPTPKHPKKSVYSISHAHTRTTRGKIQGY